MSTRHSGANKAAANPELRDAWLRPFQSTAQGSGWTPPTREFLSASLAEPGQARAVALARAYRDYARAHGDPRGADARAGQLVLERALRGDLTRPPTHTVEGTRYQRERDLQYNIRTTRAWLYGPAFMGDHGRDAHYDQSEEVAREKARTELVKGAHVSGPEGEYDLYTPSGLPLPVTTAERDRAAAQSDVSTWARQLDTLLAQKARDTAREEALAQRQSALYGRQSGLQSGRTSSRTSSRTSGRTTRTGTFRPAPAPSRRRPNESATRRLTSHTRHSPGL